VAEKDEIADIVSQAQYNYFLKQAKSAMPKTDKHHNPIVSNGKAVYQSTPLDSRGQAHRAGRDESGKVIKPGGGNPDAPPSAKQAMQALMKFHNAGKSKEQLPERSSTRNAERKDKEHAKMKFDKIIRPATRPPGTASLEKLHRQNLHASRKYVSGFISEEFNLALNGALGI
jgi:hypothetical protein